MPHGIVSDRIVDRHGPPLTSRGFLGLPRIKRHFEKVLICDFSRALANGHGRACLRDFFPPPPSRRMILPSAEPPRRRRAAPTQPSGTPPIPGCGFVQLLPCACRSNLHEKKERWPHGPQRARVEIRCPPPPARPPDSTIGRHIALEQLVRQDCTLPHSDVRRTYETRYYGQFPSASAGPKGYISP